MSKMIGVICRYQNLYITPYFYGIMYRTDIILIYRMEKLEVGGGRWKDRLPHYLC